MKKAHAIVIALLAVLLSSLASPISSPDLAQSNLPAPSLGHPVDEGASSEGLVPEEPLRLNVIQNPSFEEWNSLTFSPESWLGQASGYMHSDRAYTGLVANGDYSGFVEAQGGPVSYVQAYLNNMPIPNPLIESGISLSFNWYVVSNPDLQIGSDVFAYIMTSDDLGQGRYMYYYLSTGDTIANTSTRARFYLNDTINQWNDFDRNITEDFIDAFGSGDLANNRYISRVWLYASSPNGATDKVQAVYDDVVLYNSTYTGFLQNGGFESGTGSSWTRTESSMGYVEHSTESSLDSHSVNITIPDAGIGSGYARCFKYFGGTNEYFALYPGMTTIEVDWKYSDSIGAGVSQYAYLRFEFNNGTSYMVHYYFGRGNDDIPSNSSTNFYLKVPGFGVRDTWQHSEFDLYDAIGQLGLYNVSLDSVDLYVYQNVEGATVELLVDNFMMITYPAGDPTFEHDNLAGDPEPFLGWPRYVGATGAVTKTSDAHSGSTACNLTVSDDQEDGIYRGDLYAALDGNLKTDFWWRLDRMDSSIGGGVFIDLEFFNSVSFYHIRYLLGKSAAWSPPNTTYYRYVLADGFNQTGSWTNFARNLTEDFEGAFSMSSGAFHLSGILLYAVAAPSMTVSCIFDDIQFTDAEAPVIVTVDQSADPVFYELTLVSVEATDSRPGISSIVVNYTADAWASWNTVSATYDTGDWFDAYIPALPYDTDVEFYVIATDGCGLQAIDDNAGLFYTYTVGDDVAPDLTVTNPANNTEQEGLLPITADADDGAGSGIEYVTFNPDGSGGINDYTAPYSQNWNLDDEALGLHFIIVTAHDNAGNSVTKSYYITIVDNIAPSIDSPADVVMTVGDSGRQVNWSISDPRPHNFTVYENGAEKTSGSWSAESYFILIGLDGYLAGEYNFTLVVFDDAGNWSADTVLVTVNEVTTTETTTSGTTGGGGGGFPLGLTLAVVGAVAAVAVILVFVFVIRPKMSAK